MKAFSACIILAMVCSRALAIDVVPLLENVQLGIVVTEVKFPESLAKDLASGLTNKLLVRVALNRDSQPIAQRAVEISIKYDLWDEKFQLTSRIDNSAAVVSTYKSAQDVIASLTTLRMTPLFSAGELGRVDLTINVDMLLNPIERERIDKIRKWVADNSAYLPADAGNFDATRAADSRSNSLFNRIFEQYFAGADIAAAWRLSVNSKPFKLQDLGNAR